MGVYIPPNGDNEDETTVRSFLQDKLHYGTNPSFGLKIWGPLVPPPDNRLALHLLTGCQFILGIGLIARSRSLRNKKLLAKGINPSYDKSFKKYVYGLMGLNLDYNAGLEITRLMASIDPWEQERVYYTNLAIKNGRKVHWWFGPQNYTPMTMDNFIRHLESHVLNRIEMVDSQQINKMNQNVETHLDHPKNIVPTKTIPVSRILNHEKFTQIYNNIQQQNQVIFDNLLENDLKDVMEINKGTRLDEILEGKANFVIDEKYSKPTIILGNHQLDTDDDLDEVWDHFEPWNELGIETDFKIRLIPTTRSYEDERELSLF